jgi:hypothetical protein
MSLDSFLNSEVEIKEERKKVFQELIEEKNNEVKNIEDERSNGFKAVKLCGNCNKPLSKHEPECAWNDEHFSNKGTKDMSLLLDDDGNDVIEDFAYDEVHDKILKSLNLKWGCTEIFMYKGTMYGWGDMDHCNDSDIKHNLIQLSKMFEHRNEVRKKRHPRKKGFTSVHKMYDSDIHWEMNENFNRWCYDMKYRYKEPPFKVVTGVLVPCRWGLEIPMPNEIEGQTHT